MAAELVDSDTFTFADGDAGHSCDLGSAPAVGETDVLCVNSNTTVDTPDGFTAAESAVSNQGAYIFIRKAEGGEASTVSVNTSGDHNTFVGWSRWANLDALDTSTQSVQDGSAGTNTPVHDTGALAASGELVVAFGALHSIGTANQTDVTWSAGYTGLLNAVQGSGATGVRGLVGYKLSAGTAAEAPQVSWSTDGVQNAYLLAVTFTTLNTTRRARRMTAYIRGTEGRLNDILTVLGTTKASLWPFWEPTGTLVSGIAAGDLTASETAGAAEALEDDFAPVLLPCGLYSYHFNPTGDHHLAGVDHANFTFGDGSVDSAFSVGAWIRPNVINNNTIVGKYDSAGGAEEYKLFIDSNGKLSLELHDASASATETATADTALTAGQWVFVVATYDGGETAPAVALYVNGAEANDGSTTESGTYTAMEDTATPLTVGCGGVTATPTTEFHGRIALPFLTGRQLTAAEVETLYGYTVPMVGIS